LCPAARIRASFPGRMDENRLAGPDGVRIASSNAT
jgi:hypothetical protein